MVSGDIEAGIRLKDAAGWNQTESDWRLFLDLSPKGCFVAVCDGATVGTVTTASYRNLVGWIGMLLVDPAHRGRGIGRRLLQRALESLVECETVKLDATAAGKRLYDTAGFRSEGRVYRMIGSRNPSVPATEPDVQPIAEDSLAPLEELDRRVFGVHRAAVLRGLWRNCPSMAWQLVRIGEPTGFCLGRPGARFRQIGPIVGLREEDAAGLVAAATSGFDAEPVLLDVPEMQTKFLQRLRELGFSEQRSFVRMYRGSNRYRGLPAMQFATSGPELG
jgi:GNAT superfamily N-acetyltransferase